MSTLDKIKTKKDKKISKKGLSAIIGYVLLVVFATVVGVIVYKWQATYVPQDEYAACPGDASLFINNLRYNCQNDRLTFEITNNGQFAIGGYFVYIKDDQEKTLATLEISINNTDENSRLYPFYKINAVKLGRETLIPALNNSFKPGDVEIEEFYLPNLVNDQIYGIEIVPIRWQQEGRKEVLASCKEVKISEEIAGCETACVPVNPCGDRVCGTIMNNCYEPTICGPACPEGEFCDSTGHCVTSIGCVPTSCGVLGYNCGVWDNNCGGTLTCGDYGGGCQDGYYCDNGICTVGDIPESCDGNWEGSAEDIGVVCDGGTLCQGNCICEPGAVPNYMGGCMYIGGSQSCIVYCLDQNRLTGTEYTSSGCTQNAGQCTGPGHGDALSGGNSQCIGAPTGPICCCFPGIVYQ